MPLTEFQASRRQVLIGAGAGLACWALVSALHLGGAFEAFDHRLLDWRFRLRGERDASEIVAMVPDDDARAYGGWPSDGTMLLLTALEEPTLSVGVFPRISTTTRGRIPCSRTFLASIQP
jgi:hypothetical protein